METWAFIPGYEGIYKVSTLGNVISYVRNKEGALLKPGKGSHGYYTVSLGRHNSKTLHSLVALTFLGVRPDGMEVLHIDGTRTNNDVLNLRYGTRTDNILDAIKHGTWNMPSRIAGCAKGRAVRWGHK
jgi:hypothetical protein